jgi:hypothetical protein
MDLVEIRQGAMPFGNVAQLGDGSDVAVHGANRLEHDELRR